MSFRVAKGYIAMQLGKLNMRMLSLAIKFFSKPYELVVYLGPGDYAKNEIIRLHADMTIELREHLNNISRFLGLMSFSP